VERYEVTVGSDPMPRAEVSVAYRRRKASAVATGDGGYDAFMNALKKAVKKFGIEVPRLEDFRVRIPPGGRTGALVETLITWKAGDAEDGTFTTLGVDSDQLAAAVIATEKMLNATASRPRTAARRPSRGGRRRAS
jgi:D-citramalate synthase